VRLFEKRRDQPNKGKLVTAEKRKNKKDIKLRDREALRKMQKAA